MTIAATAEGNGWQRYGETTFVFRAPPVVLRLRDVRTDEGHVLANVHAFEDAGDGQGETRFLARARVNLTSDRSLPGFVRACQSAYPGFMTPGDKRTKPPTPAESRWPLLLDKVCAVLMEQMDSKGTRTRLTPVTGADVAQPMLFRGFVPANTVSGVLAHGGTGKSMLSLILSLAVASGQRIGPFEPLITGPVLYLDWENDARVHRRRLTRLCNGLGMPFPDNIIHYAARGKLTSAESDIVEMAYEEGAVFSVLDSIGFAAGGNLNDSETSTQAVNVLKHIPGTKLMVAHVSKIDSTAPGEAKTPIGSTFFWNGPQAVYELRTSEQEFGSVTIFAVSQNKANLGPKLRRPLGMKMEFCDPDGPITAIAHDIRGDEMGAEVLPLPLRIRDTLGREGALTTEELADKLGIMDKTGVESMARILRDLRSKKVVAGLPPEFGSKRADYRWALLAEGEATPADPSMRCYKCKAPADRYHEDTGAPSCAQHDRRA